MRTTAFKQITAPPTSQEMSGGKAQTPHAPIHSQAWLHAPSPCVLPSGLRGRGIPLFQDNTSNYVLYTHGFQDLPRPSGISALFLPAGFPPSGSKQDYNSPIFEKLSLALVMSPASHPSTLNSVLWILVTFSLQTKLSQLHELLLLFHSWAHLLHPPWKVPRFTGWAKTYL